ncbi:BAG family molecular chaperone regulator 5-like [Anoplophora glabripennis]|uniref:BAG family molecular chaperone regulator 5-like n=1 Tax=Anoplophora glabripennis TaxID=217634 RepID=UPI000873E25B|nr:BAG family molecular chaperone regulator 5-like [Anoplophora glabripennis]
MSKRNLPPQESSQFLLSELNDSNSSFEKDEDGSSKTSMNPSGSGEKMTKAAEETETEYEQIATEKIMSIKAEVEKIQQQIADYSKEQLQEEFKILEEMLIQQTLTLDNIDTRALDSVRELRKNTIRFVQDCMKQMDVKLK